MSKELFTDLTKFYEGFTQAANVVCSTLGPNGKNVYIQEPYGARVSNDGARVAYNIVFGETQKNAGAEVVKNAAAKTNDDVGDGTTTTVVLLKALYEACREYEGSSAELRQSLNEAVKKSVQLLKEKSHPLHQSEVEELALVSAEYPDLAKIISEITEKLGVDALISVEDSSDGKTSYEITDGYKLPHGYSAPLFMTDTRSQQAVYEDIPVMIAGKKIGKVQDIKRITDALDQRGIDKCVFFVTDIDEQVVLPVLIGSKLKGTFKSLVIRITPDLIPDLAAITGATPIQDSMGTTFTTSRYEDLGLARKIISDARTTLVMGDAKAAANRALELEVDAAAEPNDILKARILEKAARLRGKIAILHIGANSDFAREHKKDKAQDAVKAIPAAAAEGWVKGGGQTWKEIAKELGDSIGEQILKKALLRPSELLKESGVTDFKDIKDPAKVERVALENAAEAAGILQTVNAAILFTEAPKLGN